MQSYTCLPYGLFTLAELVFHQHDCLMAFIKPLPAENEVATCWNTGKLDDWPPTRSGKPAGEAGGGRVKQVREQNREHGSCKKGGSHSDGMR